jgi:hypothetical protein
LARARNFYGIVRVQETQHLRRMYHGAIIHGAQFVDPKRRTIATEYYGASSLVAKALKQRATQQSLHIGVLGLGVGTLARYARAQDRIQFFEINPSVERFARQYFWYLQTTPAQLSVTIGDARSSLEQLEPQQFDLLVLDVFSGDAVPMHLLSLEALKLYLGHLRSDGLLLAHITNQHLELAPVFKNFARYFGLEYHFESSPEDSAKGAAAADWVLLRRSTALNADTTVPVWTDQFSSLWEVVKW